MSFDPGLSQRIREHLAIRHDIIEKKMFGGLAFMLNGNMCCGVIDDSLMARVSPEQYTAALKDRHAREMDFTGKPLKGFIYVAPEGIESDQDLHAWIDLCVKFVASLPPK